MSAPPRRRPPRPPAPNRNVAGTGASQSSAEGWRLARPYLAVGLDPSLVSFGWAVVRAEESGRVSRIASGAFLPRRREDLHGPRTRQLHDFLAALLAEHGAADLIAVEVPGGTSSYRMRGISAHAAGRATGIAESLAFATGIPVVTPTPQQWKGRATDKRTTAAVVLAEMGYAAGGAGAADETDALGIARFAALHDGLLPRR